MPLHTDQLARTITLPGKPKRIVSLVPSQTELLYELGLDKEVVGITKFCVHPPQWFRSKPRIGGTKSVDLKKIDHLQPDLILANKEENVKEQVEALAARYPVWVSDVNTLTDALQMITGIGALTGKASEAQTMAASIQEIFGLLAGPEPALPAAYLIWKDPYMTVGGDTFIHQMLTEAGFRNVFAHYRRYPAVTVADLQQMACAVLFLSSEPYPFGQKHIDELAQHLPGTKIVLVDGELFSWYGSRLLQAPAYFRALRNQVSTLV